MIEIDQRSIKKVVNRIYKDSLTKMSADYFLMLTYQAEYFSDILDSNSFKSIISYLPNIKHKSQPFIVSVSYNIGTKDFEITVINPRIKA